jgi:hypothetical protein
VSPCCPRRPGGGERCFEPGEWRPEQVELPVIHRLLALPLDETGSSFSDDGVLDELAPGLKRGYALRRPNNSVDEAPGNGVFQFLIPFSSNTLNKSAPGCWSS